MKKVSSFRAQGLPWTSGQGTIEYLVIIAIIVVISLIVVGLTTNMIGSPSTQINSTTDKVGSMTSSGIIVVESVEDSSGESLLRLQNNSGEALTLEKVSVGGNETVFDEQLVFGDAKSFSLSDLDLSCPCTEGQESVSCTFDFYVTTQTGLSKKQTTTITTECQSSVQAANPLQVVGLGSGTLADPWIINSCNELQSMNDHLDGNYKLGVDINCLETRTWNDGNGFDPIGELGSGFEGSLNGNGKVITNLYIYRPSNQIGLIAELSSGSSIYHLGLTDLNIIGGSQVGGIAGASSGLIYGTYATGTVRGLLEASSVGGILGGVGSNGRVDNSYFIGNIFGTQSVGGLTGINQFGKINNSYFAGEITGTVFVGGITSMNVGGGSTITNCFSTGKVNSTSNAGGVAGVNMMSGLITTSYWDVNLTTKNNCVSDSNTGCTATNNLVTAYYGSNGVTKLGNDGNWVAREGNYPILSWQ